MAVKARITQKLERPSEKWLETHFRGVDHNIYNKAAVRHVCAPLLIRDVVYVVGAGFSAGLGYPLTKSLLWE
jgi:hypothetical protein